MRRATDDQYLDVCKHCIAYLSEKHSNEKGLFRSSVSQTDVRALQGQIIQFAGNTFREDPDPHLVAEVLQTTFRNLQYPLLHEIYDAIVQTDLDDEDFDISESSIQKMMVVLPEKKFFLAASLFQLLTQLASLDESDSNLIQLAYCISPTICRPMTSAYMSIRHMEDLRKIRPVISFVIENYDEVFTEGLQPNSDLAMHDSAMKKLLPGQIYGFGSFSDIKPVNSADEGEISAMMSTSMVIDTMASATKVRDDISITSMDDAGSVSSGERGDMSTSSGGGSNKDGHSSAGNSPQTGKANLMVSIPLVNGTEITVAEADSLQHFSDAEWNMLESLITARVSAFLDFEDKLSDTMLSSRSNSFKSRSNSLDIAESPGALNGGPNSRLHSNLNHKDGGSHSGPPSPAAHPHSAGSGPHSPASSPLAQPKIVLKNRRRRMVADCKALRAQIFDFEQEWTKKHNRVPKNFERGSMESIYTRYRKLKKEIRDLAAIDMQRVARGFVVRSRMGRIKKRPRKQLIQPASGVPGSSPAAAATGGNNTVTVRAGGGAAVTTLNSRRTVTNDDSVQSGATTVPSASTSTTVKGTDNAATAPSGDLYAQYRQLLVQKRDLKRELKKFDEDFLAKNGRAPRKSDKEVIRPMYQTYHELKSKLDKLRGTIESSHGPLPDDLQDDNRSVSTLSLSMTSVSGSGHDLLQSLASNSESSTPGGDGSRSMALSPDRQGVKPRSSKLSAAGAAVIGDYSEDESITGISSQGDDDDSRMRTGSDDLRISNDDIASTLLSKAAPSTALNQAAGVYARTAATPSGVAETEVDAEEAAQVGSGGNTASGVTNTWKHAAAAADMSFNHATTKVINVEGELEALQVEKRNLHAYLKVYERDFSRLHGRPVTKHADIQPVAHEYQRYKELKALIKEKKNNMEVK